MRDAHVCVDVALEFVDLTAPAAVVRACVYEQRTLYICSCFSFWPLVLLVHSKWTISINDIIIGYFFPPQLLILGSHAYEIHVSFLYLSEWRVGVSCCFVEKYIPCGYFQRFRRTAKMCSQCGPIWPISIYLLNTIAVIHNCLSSFISHLLTQRLGLLEDTDKPLRMKKKTDQQNEIDSETRRDVAWTVKSLLI